MFGCLASYLKKSRAYNIIASLQGRLFVCLLILSAGPNVFVLPEMRTEFERTTFKACLVSMVNFFNAKNVIMAPAGRGGRGKTSRGEPLPISQLEVRVL